MEQAIFVVSLPKTFKMAFNKKGGIMSMFLNVDLLSLRSLRFLKSYGDSNVSRLSVEGTSNVIMHFGSNNVSTDLKRTI